MSNFSFNVSLLTNFVCECIKLIKNFEKKIIRFGKKKTYCLTSFSNVK